MGEVTLVRPPLPRARVLAALLAVLILIWGFNYLVVRTGLGVSPPLWLATFRAGIGALAVFGLLLARGSPRRLDARGRRFAALLGVPNTAAFFGLWFVAASYVLPGETSVVIYTFPLWVTLLSAAWTGERLGAVGLVALGSGFGGVALIARAGTLRTGAPGLLPLAALLGGALAWAVGTVLIQRRFQASEMFEVNAYQLLGGAIGLGIAAALVEGVPFSSNLGELLPVALYLGIVGTAVAYGIWFWLLGRVPAGELSRYLFLVPVVALVASIGLLGERLDAAQTVGVVLVLCAVYLTGRARTHAARGSRPAESREPG